jgi:hypothetical protein
MVRSSGPIVFGVDGAVVSASRARLTQRWHERGQAIVLVLIVVAILAGIAWWLILSRHESEAQARDFARDAATRLAVNFDRKFLDRVIAPDRVAKYPPSYRDRVIEKLRGFGQPIGPVEVEGDVIFQSYFFQPSGTFEAKLKYAHMPAAIHLAVSRPKGWWQIDDLNISWNQPAPAPAPVLQPTPAPPPGG